MTRWYQSRWWYVERPFPLPLIVACAVALLVVGAFALGFLA